MTRFLLSSVCQDLLWGGVGDLPTAAPSMTGAAGFKEVLAESSLGLPWAHPPTPPAEGSMVACRRYCGLAERWERKLDALYPLCQAPIIVPARHAVRTASLSHSLLSLN